MSDPPIEFHEDEYCQSPIEEDTLRILLSFLPRSEYDKLLIGQVNYVRPDIRHLPKRVEIWRRAIGNRSIARSNHANENVQEETEEVYAIFVSA